MSTNTSSQTAIQDSVNAMRKFMKDNEEVMRSKDGRDIPVGSIDEITVKTKKRDTPVRIYSPAGKSLSPAVVYLHGGGFVMGSYNEDSAVCRQMCRDVECVVFSIDYGLAPENPFPDPVEEIYEVVQWIFKNSASYNVDPNRIAIGGSSAGANLSVVTCILAMQRKEFSFVHMVLVYPPLNLSIDAAQKAIGKKAPSIISPDIAAKFDLAYVGDRANTHNILVSPELIENSAGLPPATLFSAEIDLLYKEQERFAQKLRDAGVEILHKHYAGIDHGFLGVAGLEEYARDCKEVICAQLRSAFRRKQSKK